MERIDVLKGVEQFLVQKAYETGHISHRADGDWQKQADGSWVPYKGQSAQNPNKKDRYGFNLLPDEDKQGYLDRANGDSYQAQILYEKDVENSPMGGLDEEEDQYDEITEEDLVETPEVDLYDDDQIGFSSYANNINIDNGVIDDDDLEDVANQILLDNDLEVNDDNMNKARNAMLGWLDANGYLDDDDVEKSAVRDMRSAPTTKNMGF